MCTVGRGTLGCVHRRQKRLTGEIVARPIGSDSRASRVQTSRVLKPARVVQVMEALENTKAPNSSRPYHPCGVDGQAVTAVSRIRSSCKRSQWTAIEEFSVGSWRPNYLCKRSRG